MPRPPRGGTLKRTVGTREPKKRVVVVCEGSKTEPDYLNQLTRRARNALIHLVIADAAETSPKQLVERASDILRASRKEARKARDVNARADEVWCAFDVDEHPRLTEAVDQAEANGVHLAISNPSVELWFLLHHQESQAYVHRDDARRTLQSHVPAYAKGAFELEPFVGKFSDARDRALRLAEKHEGDATKFPANNPSSTMWKLVETLEAQY